jgi:hypothetical protein
MPEYLIINSYFRKVRRHKGEDFVWYVFFTPTDIKLLECEGSRHNYERGIVDRLRGLGCQTERERALRSKLSFTSWNHFKC